MHTVHDVGNSDMTLFEALFRNLDAISIARTFEAFIDDVAVSYKNPFDAQHLYSLLCSHLVASSTGEKLIIKFIWQSKGLKCELNSFVYYLDGKTFVLNLSDDFIDRTEFSQIKQHIRILVTRMCCTRESMPFKFLHILCPETFSSFRVTYFPKSPNYVAIQKFFQRTSTKTKFKNMFIHATITFQKLYKKPSSSRTKEFEIKKLYINEKNIQK